MQFLVLPAHRLGRVLGLALVAGCVAVAAAELLMFTHMLQRQRVRINTLRAENRLLDAAVRARLADDRRHADGAAAVAVGDSGCRPVTAQA